MELRFTGEVMPDNVSELQFVGYYLSHKYGRGNREKGLSTELILFERDASVTVLDRCLTTLKQGHSCTCRRTYMQPYTNSDIQQRGLTAINTRPNPAKTRGQKRFEERRL